MRSFYETKINCTRSLLQFSLLQRNHLLFYRFLSVAFLLILTISLRQKTAVNVTDHLYTIVCRYCKFKIKSKVSYSHKKNATMQACFCKRFLCRDIYTYFYQKIRTKKFLIPQKTVVAEKNGVRIYRHRLTLIFTFFLQNRSIRPKILWNEPLLLYRSRKMHHQL